MTRGTVIEETPVTERARAQMNRAPLATGTTSAGEETL
jgi:hypothetical protein